MQNTVKTDVFSVLTERGYIEQTTHAEEIRKLLNSESVTFYIGFDPTADSLTIGHFLTVMAMAHMQRAGHRPIILVGGGTGMVGDPTDKNEMRRVMTREEVGHNVECFKKQLSKFIDISDGKAIIADNADWLLQLNYVNFLREVGIHFSVNRMLTADCYKSRLEKGLSFFEFNYMLMQSYDFLELYRRFGCKMQLGGNDQWSNIIGGVELIRRADNADAYGMTFKLLTTSAGVKMGKSQAGAVWLDPDKTSPFEFFQYLRNVSDEDVYNCLCLLTFLPMDEIKTLTAKKDSSINAAKEVLAYEATKLVHGESAADDALKAARALFSGGGDESSVPSTEMPSSAFEPGMNIIELLEKLELIGSRGEGRRLITQGGVSVNGEKVTDIDRMITSADFKDNALTVQKGKKSFHKVKLV